MKAKGVAGLIIAAVIGGPLVSSIDTSKAKTNLTHNTDVVSVVGKSAGDATKAAATSGKAVLSGAASVIPEGVINLGNPTTTTVAADTGKVKGA